MDLKVAIETRCPFRSLTPTEISEEVSRCAMSEKRSLTLGVNCRREAHAELQLPREIAVEKSGEFREACFPRDTENDNPEPSLDRKMTVREGAETRANARTLIKIQWKRPTPSPRYSEAGEQIVQAHKKFWGTCNH